MTRAEFMAKYGDVDVVFSSYFKYNFTYAATLPDGKRLSVRYGGCDDIYRHGVEAGVPVKVAALEPDSGAVYDGDKEVEGFYEH